MYRQTNIPKTIWIVVTLALFSMSALLYAAGDDRDKPTSNKEKATKQQEISERAARPALLCKVSDLIGSDVKSRASTPMSPEERSGPASGKDREPAEQVEPNPHAEKIGTVGELVICDNVDKVHYIILTSQDKHYPVPWWAFEVHGLGLPAGTRHGSADSDDLKSLGVGWDRDLGAPEVSTPRRDRGPARKPVLFLNVTKELLRQAPTIDSSISLEKLSDSRLTEKVDSFYSRHIGTEKDRREMGHPHREAQAAPSAGGKEKYVQEEARSQEKAPGSKTLAGPANLLKASKVVGLKLQDSRNADLGKVQNLLVDAREGHLAYGLVSFGGFLGIGDRIAAVPWSALTVEMSKGYARLDASRQTLEAAVIDEDNIEKLAELQFARQIHDKFGTPPYWEVLGFVPGEETEGAMNPWLPDSKYNKNFDPAKVITIVGTIRSVGAFYPESGAAPGISLDVETKEGKSVTVHAGPSNYAAQKNIDLKPGSKISLIGCQTEVNGKSVILASEIRVEGKTLRLRDRQGRPEWKTAWKPEKPRLEE